MRVPRGQTSVIYKVPPAPEDALSPAASGRQEEVGGGAPSVDGNT